MKSKLTLHSAALLAFIAAAPLNAQVPAAPPADVGAPPVIDPAAPVPAVELPAAGLPAPVADEPAAVPGFPGAGAPPSPVPVKPPPVPAPPRVKNLTPPPPAALDGIPHSVPSSGGPGAMPGAPAMPTPPPAGGSGHGVSGSAELIPGKKHEYHLQKLSGPDKKPLTVVAREKSVQRGEDIIRDTKLKVYQRHYETVLNEAIQARLTLLDAPPEKQEALKARQAALEEIAKKLEADIRELSSPPRVSARFAPDGGAVMVSEAAEGTVVKELPVHPGGGGGVVELHDEKGNTFRFSQPPVKR